MKGLTPNELPCPTAQRGLIAEKALARLPSENRSLWPTGALSRRWRHGLANHCVSYVNPSACRQADAEEVASKIRTAGIIQRLVAQPQGLERALRAAASMVACASRLRHLLAQEHRQVGARRHGRAAHVAQDLQGPRHARRMGHHPRRLRLQLRRRALNRADPAARAVGPRRGRARGLQAQGHKTHRRHGLGHAALGERYPAVRPKGPPRDRACICTKPAQPASPAYSAAHGRHKFDASSRAWAAARLPRPTARPATSAPRTSPSCARRWAWRPDSTSIA